jgi:hypothetical protein
MRTPGPGRDDDTADTTDKGNKKNDREGYENGTRRYPQGTKTHRTNTKRPPTSAGDACLYSFVYRQSWMTPARICAVSPAVSPRWGGVF